MHRYSRKICLFLAMLGGSHPARTQPLESPDMARPGVDLSDGLSADEAVALALARNPSLIALEKGRAVAQAYVSQSSLPPSPEVRVGVSDIAADPDGLGSRRTNVGLRWSPPRPGELGLKSAIARSKVDEVSGSIGVAKQRLVAEVRLLHQTIALIEEQIRIAEQTLRLHEEILVTVGAQLAAGTKSSLDQSLAELSVADARAVPERYKLERRLQISRLAAKLDLPRSYEVKLQTGGDQLDYRPPQFEREQLIASALEHRMELKTADARCTQAQLASKAARRERYPWISFTQINRRLGAADDPSAWGFQVGVEIPVFRWRSDALEATSAALSQCRLEQQALKAAIASEIDELRLRLESAQGELQHYVRASGSLSDRNVELSRAALSEGQVDAVEPLLAQARQMSAKLAYVTKLMDVREIEAALTQATGAKPGQ